jgi:amino acid adenylation domain-containing protein
MSDLLLQQILTKTAKQYPNKQAAIVGLDSITYQELEALSNRLAYVLQKEGIEKGDRVGICLPKSIEAIAAIFGILKAGAVYVPLNPSAPQKWLESAMTNCQMKALIITKPKCQGLDLAQIQTIIIVDEGEPLVSANSPEIVSWQQLLQAPSVGSAVISTKDDLAYILYTSGSTGDPKGVAIHQEASLNFINWSCECFQVSATDRVANHAPLHFDLSVFDIFTTIKAGGTAVVVPDRLSIFPQELAKFISQQQITIWYSVPSVLIQLATQGNLENYNYSHLRHILFAGDVFPLKYLIKLTELIPTAQYHNLYGPTETNVCTYYPVPKIIHEGETLPIGKACANNKVYALNEGGEIAKVGEIGELYVQGPSVMKGYWGQPEKTNSVSVLGLIPAFWEGSQERAYKTGDFVKLDAEGNYIFIGRRDRTVKSRGYRIDLGAIEAILYRHPQVKEVAVIAIPNEEIGNQILAIVVPLAKDDHLLTATQLKSFAAKYLPKHTIPHQIDFCELIPKTSTGKIDRNQLVNLGK